MTVTQTIDLARKVPGYQDNVQRKLDSLRGHGGPVPESGAGHRKRPASTPPTPTAQPRRNSPRPPQRTRPTPRGRRPRPPRTKRRCPCAWSSRRLARRCSCATSSGRSSVRWVRRGSSSFSPVFMLIQRRGSTRPPAAPRRPRTPAADHPSARRGEPARESLPRLAGGGEFYLWHAGRHGAVLHRRAQRHAVGPAGRAAALRPLRGCVAERGGPRWRCRWLRRTPGGRSCGRPGCSSCWKLLTGNALEPWLYGTSTGLSPAAIIVAATFWTWLWGGAGAAAVHGR